MAQSLESAIRGKRNGRAAVRARASDVMEDFAELREDVSRLADAAGNAARAEVASARHKLREAGSAIATRARSGAAYVSDQVREHPAAALGVSLGAGVLLGLLLSRR